MQPNGMGGNAHRETKLLPERVGKSGLSRPNHPRDGYEDLARRTLQRDDVVVVVVDDDDERMVSYQGMAWHMSGLDRRAAHTPDTRGIYAESA